MHGIAWYGMVWYILPEPPPASEATTTSHAHPRPRLLPPSDPGLRLRHCTVPCPPCAGPCPALPCLAPVLPEPGCSYCTLHWVMNPPMPPMPTPMPMLALLGEREGKKSIEPGDLPPRRVFFSRRLRVCVYARICSGMRVVHAVGGGRDKGGAGSKRWFIHSFIHSFSGSGSLSVQWCACF